MGIKDIDVRKIGSALYPNTNLEKEKKSQKSSLLHPPASKRRAIRVHEANVGDSLL
jgi:hypothetical protein